MCNVVVRIAYTAAKSGTPPNLLKSYAIYKFNFVVIFTPSHQVTSNKFCLETQQKFNLGKRKVSFELGKSTQLNLGFENPLELKET